MARYSSTAQAESNLSVIDKIIWVGATLKAKCAFVNQENGYFWFQNIINLYGTFREERGQLLVIFVRAENYAIIDKLNEHQEASRGRTREVTAHNHALRVFIMVAARI